MATALPPKLEDQAASAALHAQKDKRGSANKSSHSILDEDGKLSSASAATSLKYAKAKDLPSFPSAGLKMSSAGAAASLADSNKKSFEHWKPGEIPAANTAAMLAKDYEADPLWQPELSTAGSKAALLAHRDTPTVELWKSSGSAEGQSAADQALKGKSATRSTTKAPAKEVPSDAHRKALMAATGAMSGTRPRSDSVPTTANDTKSWALKAATKSHRDSPASQPFASGDPGFEAARIQNLAKNNPNRQLFGSAPPVDIEVEEKKRQDMLRASAVAMAQKMYAIQQTHIDEAARAGNTESRTAANSSHRRNISDVSSGAPDSVSQPRYENLEEAARRLAQERLAKLHDEHAEYRSYYGATSPQNKSRLSTRIRRRASIGNDSDSDREQSQRIRTQMSMFTTKLAEVDKNKRQADRDKLLEVAHKNVEARMNKMDEQVFQNTGKSSPAQRELWERQARERAQKKVDLALQNVGKVHIGGGQYLDQEEVDAIAKARLQPTLDDINDKAEKMRARDEEIRLDQARIEAESKAQKARDAEIKADLKAAQDREKHEQKAKKEEERRAQKELVSAEKEKAKLEKEEQRRSKEVKAGRFSSILRRKSVTATETNQSRSTEETPASVTVVSATTAGDEPFVHDQVTQSRHDSSNSSSTGAGPRYEDTLPPTTTGNEATSATSKRDSRVKSWFKTHLRSPSKVQKDEGPAAAATEKEKVKDESLKDVALAGRASETEDGHASSAAAPISPVAAANAPASNKSSSISSMSSSEPDATIHEQATNAESTAQYDSKGKGFKGKLLSKLRNNKDQTTADGVKKGNTNDEDSEEARDKFEEKLSPPPNLAGERPRSSHEGSKFKEEL